MKTSENQLPLCHFQSTAGHSWDAGKFEARALWERRLKSLVTPDIGLIGRGVGDPKLARHLPLCQPCSQLPSHLTPTASCCS